MKLRSLLVTVSLIAVWLLLTACQPSDTPEPLPTLVRFPTLTAAPSASTTPPPATGTPEPTATITPTTAPTVTQLPAATTIQVILTIPPALPTSTTEPLPEQFIFGRSASGNDLIAYRMGTGSRVIVLVGGIHTGYEANTVELLTQMRETFQMYPQQILPEITLLLIPLLNPDGMAYGRSLRGRFNGNEVDLNRNWGCGWSADAVFREGSVNAGSAPFSEPESTALGSLIQRVNPTAVLIYHAAANGIFAGECARSTAPSHELARIYGEASGYPFDGAFAEYAITGSAPAWLASIGIPALDIELATSTGTELERNLRALQAVQLWAASRN